MIYLVMFCLSSILIHFAEVSQKKRQSKLVYCFLVIISLLLSAAMAGVRDETVGSDVLGYGRGTFLSSIKYHSLSDFIAKTDLENGYCAINYIVSRFTDNPHWFYFIIALLMNIFVFWGVYRYKKAHSNFRIALAMFVYYTVFYNQSLNILRQSLAIAIILFAVNFMFEKKYVKYIILCFCAMLFHTSAIICVCFLPIYILISKYPNMKSCVFVVVGGILVVVFYNEISKYLMGKGIFPEKYERYMGSGEDFAFKWDSMIVRSPIILLGIIGYKKLSLSDKNNLFFLMMMILEVVFMQLEVFFVFAARINIYVMAFRVFYMVNITGMLISEKSTYTNAKMNAMLLDGFVMLYSVVIWWYSIIIQNNNCTFPYTSAILGI